MAAGGNFVYEKILFYTLDFTKYKVLAIAVSTAMRHYIVCILCRRINCFCIEVGKIL